MVQRLRTRLCTLLEREPGSVAVVIDDSVDYRAEIHAEVTVRGATMPCDKAAVEGASTRRSGGIDWVQ